MFKRSFMAAAALLGALLLPGVASAQSLAFSAPGATNMRAGPGPGFPVIAQVVGGSRVQVIGCIADYAWCDSVVQGYRGWISTTRLEFPYAGRRVAAPRYYASFGAPIIGFDFGYWDRHYSRRPFFRERDRFDRDWRDSRRYGDRDRRDRDRDFDRDGRGRSEFSERGGRRGDDRDWERERRGESGEGRRGRGDDRDFARRGEDRGGRDGEMEVRAGDDLRGGEFRRGRGDGEGRRGRGDSPEGCIVAEGGGLICP